MSPKKIPQRMCNGCGQMFDKKSLIRVVCTPEGSIVLDTTGRQAGRGAYLCPSAECLKKAIKTKRLERSLKTPFSPEIYEQLQSCIAQAEAQKEKDA